jgi:long-chain acyl-CoA synthetase
VTNLAQNLADASRRYGDRTAIKLDATEIRYRALDAAASSVARLLGDLGVRPGDRVGVMLPNVPQFAIAYYGILRAGGVVVPMNVLLKERETEHYLGDSQAKAVFAWHEFAQPARAGAAETGATCVVVGPGEFAPPLAKAGEMLDEPREQQDTAVILYTSGTTGSPKGAELTHGGLNRNASAVVDLLALGEDGEVILGALPLFHSFGQTSCLNASISAGACLTLLPRFDPGKALKIIERDRVTVFQGVPTMYSALLHHADCERYDVSSLKFCVSGGAALPVEVLRQFEETFGCTVLEGYGLSETSPVASFNHRGRPRKAGSVGTPIAGVEMKVVDDHGRDLSLGEVGEIVIRGHNVMKGYWNNPQATADAIDGDGWFRTGDMARMDEDGYFFIVDRKKDVIIRGGYNVYPREIEDVLYEHPAVREAAVIGVPHDELGEEVAAVVALKPGSSVAPEQLRTYVKERVAAYKYPRHVWYVDELPKGSTGKILKRAIEIPKITADSDGQAGIAVDLN